MKDQKKKKSGVKAGRDIRIAKARCILFFELSIW